MVKAKHTKGMMESRKYSFSNGKKTVTANAAQKYKPSIFALRNRIEIDSCIVIDEVQTNRALCKNRYTQCH